MVGRHDVREAVRPHQIPDGLLLCSKERRNHFAAALTIALDRSCLTGVYVACRTAIGRTSNKSAAADLGPVTALPAARTLRIPENPSVRTDAF